MFRSARRYFSALAGAPTGSNLLNCEHSRASLGPIANIKLHASAPMVARVGSRNSPQLHKVRYAEKGSTICGVDTFFDERGKLMVSGGLYVTRGREVLAKLSATEHAPDVLAGMSTTERYLAEVSLAGPLRDPQRRVWTLEEGTPIPPSLAVRTDPHVAEDRHVLWAPAHSMPLSEYVAALQSVGSSTTDAWRCWDSPVAALVHLGVPAEERDRLMRAARAMVVCSSIVPATPSQLTGQAIISLAMAEADFSTAGAFLDIMASVGVDLVSGSLALAAILPTAARAIATTQPADRMSFRTESSGGREHRLIVRTQVLTPADYASSAAGVAFTRRALIATYDQMKARLNGAFDGDDDDDFRTCEDMWRLWKPAADAFRVPY